jgi:lipopolysaccharide biosynthesis protein
MSIFRKAVSLGYWLLDSEKSLSDFRKKIVWKEEDLLVETPSEKIMSPLVITAHIFYPEFAIQFIDSLQQLPKETKVFATTPSEEIKEDLERYLTAAGNRHDVRLTPNIGRNFGPLLVEFSKQLLMEESFIHVHSKKSLHSPEIGTDWLKRNTDLLLTPDGLRRVSSIVESIPKVGLVCVDAADLLWGVNFRWGRSRKIVRKTFYEIPGFKNLKLNGRIKFPAGGMFWIRTEAIRPLLEMDWSYENFPREEGQRDGELQHGIERMIGELTATRGLRLVALLPSTNRFH